MLSEILKMNIREIEISDHDFLILFNKSIDELSKMDIFDLEKLSLVISRMPLDYQVYFWIHIPERDNLTEKTKLRLSRIQDKLTSTKYITDDLSLITKFHWPSNRSFDEILDSLEIDYPITCDMIMQGVKCEILDDQSIVIDLINQSLEYINTISHHFIKTEKITNLNKWLSDYQEEFQLYVNNKLNIDEHN